MSQTDLRSEAEKAFASTYPQSYAEIQESLKYPGKHPEDTLFNGITFHIETDGKPTYTRHYLDCDRPAGGGTVWCP